MKDMNKKIIGLKHFVIASLKHFVIAVLDTAILLTFLAGCSNLAETGSQDNTAEKKYYIKGSVSLGAENGAGIRTATSSFNGTDTWVITAAKDGKKYSPANYTTGKAFAFAFEEPGEYLIEAKIITADNICFYGSKTLSVTEAGVTGVRIIAEPKASFATGKVELEVNLDTETAKKVKFLSVKWIGLEDRKMNTIRALGEATEPEELTAWEQKCTNGEFDKIFPFADGRATIDINGIFYGAHSVQLIFTDKADGSGNTIYSCNEMINVYSGMTTDTWYGSAPYLSDGKFTLTQSNLNVYGTDIVPETPYAIYDYNSTSSNYNFYFVNTADATLPSTASASSSYDSIAFDSEGNYYALNYDEVIFENRIVSSKTGFSLNNPASYSAPHLFIDRKTDKLYVYEFNEDDNENGHAVYLYEYLLSNPSELSRKYCLYTGSYSTTYKPSIMTAYDGIVYGIEVPSNTYADPSGKLFSVKLSECERKTDPGDNVYYEYISLPVIVNELLTGFDLDYKKEGSSFTDIIYQDDAVYILFRNVMPADNPNITGSFPVYSRGAIIKYDTLTRQLQKKCWTTDSLDSTGKYIYGYDDYNHSLWKKISSTEKEKAKLNSTEASGKYPDLFVPQAPDAGLYGPQKFIALKPKKLVIADNGLAFYTDSLGAYTYKYVSRVVTVDLENFILEETEVNTCFGSNYTSVLKGSGFYVYLSDYSDSSSIYSNENCSGSIYGESGGDRIYLGFPRKED